MNNSKNKSGCLVIVLIFAVFLTVIMSFKTLNIMDSPVNSSLQNETLDAARSYVRSSLKDKTGAIFDRNVEKIIQRKDGSVSVAGSVRSKNSFGALLDNEWMIHMKRGSDGASWDFVWMQVGDATLGTLPDNLSDPIN